MQKPFLANTVNKQRGATDSILPSLVLVLPPAASSRRSGSTDCLHCEWTQPMGANSKNATAPGVADTLCERAERLPKRRKQDRLTALDTEADLRTQLRELQISSLMALQQARIETEAAVKCHADLYDLAPIAYFTFDRAGIVCDANLAAGNLIVNANE